MLPYLRALGRDIPAASKKDLVKPCDYLISIHYLIMTKLVKHHAFNQARLFCDDTA